MLKVRVMEKKSGGIIADFSNVENIESDTGDLFIHVCGIYMDPEDLQFCFREEFVTIDVSIQ